MSDTHRKCEICGIKERLTSEKLFFARFPLDKNRCAEWVKLVGKEDLAYLPIEKLHSLRHVCQYHFVKRDFTKTKTCLKSRAVPRLNLTAPPLSDNIMTEFLQLNSHVALPSVSQQQFTRAATSTSAANVDKLPDPTFHVRSDSTPTASTSRLTNVKPSPDGLLTHSLRKWPLATSDILNITDHTVPSSSTQPLMS